MSSEVNLDEIYNLISPEAKRYDPSLMLARAIRMPENLLESLENYQEVVSNLRLPDPENVNGIVISGMGGSFISGLFLQDLVIDRSQKAVILNRDVRLPKFVNEKHLLIAVSYSGNTEETLRVYLEGVRRNLPMVAITSGGELADASKKMGIPLISLPPGIPPRAAFPFITAAIVALTSIYLGVNLVSEVREACQELSRDYTSRIGEGVSLSRLLSGDIKGGLTPVIYGYSPYLSAAYRFKTQINENAKLHAFFGELPEANHNEIMGWGSLLNKFTVVFVRGREEPDYMKARLEFLEGVLEKYGVPFYNMKGESGSRACELLSLILKGDVASISLALRFGRDPAPVETISQLKKFLESKIGFSLGKELKS